jgi:hypothetical protein
MELRTERLEHAGLAAVGLRLERRTWVQPVVVAPNPAHHMLVCARCGAEWAAHVLPFAAAPTNCHCPNGCHAAQLEAAVVG